MPRRRPDQQPSALLGVAAALTVAALVAIPTLRATFGHTDRPASTSGYFWQVIADARHRTGNSVDGDRVAEQVTALLARRDPKEIVEFGVYLDGLEVSAYRWDLWGAAYLINGGCSDDCFDYFQGWLVAQGRSTWDAALADPDSLATIMSRKVERSGVESEDMLGAAAAAYAQATGHGEQAYWNAVTKQSAPWPDEPAGGETDFEDGSQTQSAYPRLSAYFDRSHTGTV